MSHKTPLASRPKKTNNIKALVCKATQMPADKLAAHSVTFQIFHDAWK
jgi:hypothetical protein